MGSPQERALVIAQPSSAKLHRQQMKTNTDIMQRMVSPQKERLHQNSPLGNQETPQKRRQRRRESQEQKTSRTQDPLRQYTQHSDELTETEAACTWPIWVCTRSSVHVLWLPVQCCAGIPETENQWVSAFWAFSWALFLPFVCHIQPWWYVCFYLCCNSYYILLYYWKNERQDT